MLNFKTNLERGKQFQDPNSTLSEYPQKPTREDIFKFKLNTILINFKNINAKGKGKKDLST